MADDVLKTILYEIRANAEQALQVQQKFRSDMEATKQTFQELQRIGGESFDVIKAQMESIVVTPLTQQLDKLKAKLRSLQKEELGGVVTVDTSGIEASIQRIQGEIRAVRAAFKELGKEASQIEVPILNAADGAELFTQNVAEARVQMLELVEAGYSVQAAFEGVKQTGLFSPTELSAAKTQVTALVKLQEQLGVAQLTSVERAQLYTQNVDLAKQEMMQLVQAGYSVKAAMVGIDDGRFTRGEITEAVRKLKEEMGLLGTQTSKTARILERIFAAAIIGYVLGAVRGLINNLREATEAGAELARSLLDVAVQARALRREGGTLLPSDWIRLTRELSDVFTQFSQKDINSAVSQLIRLGRQAKLTDEQIRNLIDNTLTLATVMGIDAADAANAVATAIESGYARGLKELVGVFDETTLNQEAVNRGYAKTADEVDRTTRALVALQILQEEGIVVGEELARIQESTTGQYLGNKNAIETLKASIGEALLPTMVALQDAFIELLKFLDRAIQGLQLFNIAAQSLVMTLKDLMAIALIAKPIDILTGKVKLGAVAIELYKQNFIELTREINPKLLEEFGEEIDNVSQSIKDAVPNLEELIEKFKDVFDDIRELFIDLGEDIAKENRKWQQDVLEDAEKFAFEWRQTFEDELFDRAKIYRQFNDKIIDAQDDYRDREIEAEEDYQEKLRKLREQFLFDLEDALRERDARQVLRLIRQYNLRKTQLGRERELEKEENERRFQDEVEDARRQRDIRLRELAIEYDFRRQQMDKEYQFERQLREQQHQERLAEIRLQAREKFDELLRELQDSGEITAQEAEVIAKVFDEFFGEGGAVEGSVDNLIAMLEEAKNAAIQSISEIKAIEIPEGLWERRKTPSQTFFEIDESDITKQTKKVTDAFKKDFGEDGEVIGILEYFVGKIKGYISKDVPEALQDEKGSISQSASGIVDILRASFGPDGSIEGIFIYLVGMIVGQISSVIAAINRLKAVLAGLRALGRTSPNTNVGGGGGPKKAAEGGTYFANRPTTITFGEAGWEMAEFTPLDKPGQNVGKMFGEGISSRNDRIELMVRMEDGLIAEIVDTTLDQTATVILNVERARL